MAGTHSSASVSHNGASERRKLDRKRELHTSFFASVQGPDGCKWRAVPDSRDSYPKSHDSRPLIAAQCFIFLLDFVAATTLMTRFLSSNARRSTLVAVLALSTSLVLSVISAAVYAHALSLNDLSTTFWVAVAAGCFALPVLVLLVWEVVRTRRYHIPLTRIAVKQRSLVLTFYMFLMYLTIGAVMFKFAANFMCAPPIRHGFCELIGTNTDIWTRSSLSFSLF